MAARASQKKKKVHNYKKKLGLMNFEAKKKERTRYVA
jgi:hypothetical protein